MNLLFWVIMCAYVVLALKEAEQDIRQFFMLRQARKEIKRMENNR